MLKHLVYNFIVTPILAILSFIHMFNEMTVIKWT